MKTYWIIGGGTFGQRAAHVIKVHVPASRIVVIEKTSRACQKIRESGFETVHAEGIRFLEHNLVNSNFPDWIIPAIPLHVAFEWMQRKLSATHAIETLSIPDRLETLLPNPLRGSAGQLYVSNADFICPDDCSEPDGICTFTGEPRPRLLYAYLKECEFKNFRSVVVRSQQLFAGVGGYTPRALFQALEEVESESRPMLLSTACCCHGVLHAFRIV